MLALTWMRHSRNPVNAVVRPERQTLKRLRWSLRTSLAVLAVTGLVFAAARHFYNIHKQSNVRELDAISVWKLDIYGYETENALPDWLSAQLPQEIALCFEHIYEIDLQFNDLSVCDPSDVRDLHACEWVHTLRVPNVTMSAEMFDAVSQFPRLKNIYIRNWYDEDDAHDVDLRDATVAGVTITMINSSGRTNEALTSRRTR